MSRVTGCGVMAAPVIWDHVVKVQVLAPRMDNMYWQMVSNAENVRDEVVTLSLLGCYDWMVGNSR